MSTQIMSLLQQLNKTKPAGVKRCWLHLSALVLFCCTLYEWAIPLS